MPEVPLRLGTAEQFAAVKRLFERNRFTEASLNERLDESQATQNEPANDFSQPLEARDALDALAALYIRGRSVKRERLEELVGGDACGLLEALGLLGTREGSLCHGTVRLSPMESLLVVSDRWSHPDGAPFEMFDDIVYPADVKNVRELMGFLPETRCDRLLDVCAGTGIFAMQGAQKYAREAFAYDIADRCTAFAEFNARLNGLEQMECATGDVYQPAQGRTFDRIVAHPPYVPVLDKSWIFHGGGQDGEQITRKVIGDAPKVLAPGGRLYCLSLGSDRAGAPLQHRVREWLGEAQGEFDVCVLIKKHIEPMKFAANSVLRKDKGKDEFELWRSLLKRLEIAELLQTLFVVQRREGDRAVFTVRHDMGPQTTKAEIEWLLKWETDFAARGAKAFVDARLMTNPSVRLEARYRQEGGQWTPKEYVLRTSYPFQAEWAVEPWASYLIPKCDGRYSVRSLWEQLKADEVILPETPLDEFTQAASQLLSGGFLQIAGHGMAGPKEVNRGAGAEEDGQWV